MIHDVFGEIVFSVGWKAPKDIRLFNKEYTISLKIQAYYEEDGITVEQENAYREFCKAESDKLQLAEKLLMDYSDSAKVRYIPKTLLFNRDGSYALLCDDDYTPEEGVAVCLYPNEAIVSQDDYL